MRGKYELSVRAPCAPHHPLFVTSKHFLPVSQHQIKFGFHQEKAPICTPSAALQLPQKPRTQLPVLTRSSFSSAPPRGGAGTEAAESPSPTGTWAGAPHEQPFPRVFKPQSLGPGCLLGVWGASDLGRGLRLQGANCPPAPHWPTFAFCLEPL